jgi:hypothetical protein
LIGSTLRESYFIAVVVLERGGSQALILSRNTSSSEPSLNCLLVMVQKKDTALLASAFAKVASNQKYWNQWIVADVWATLINQELQLPDELMVTGGYFTLNLLRSLKYKSIEDVVDIYHNPNELGLLEVKFVR